MLQRRWTRGPLLSLPGRTATARPRARPRHYEVRLRCGVILPLRDIVASSQVCALRVERVHRDPPPGPGFVARTAALAIFPSHGAGA